MVNVVAVIPARSGSKSVVDKNIKLLGEHPLIAYSIAAAQLASGIDRIVVSTDSVEYASTAREYGAEVPFLRSPEISGDSSTDYEWIKHVLDWMKNEENFVPNYLVHLRPTTPLREPKCIDAAIDLIKKTNYATALRSIHEMSESAYKAFEVEGDYLKPIGSNSFALDASNEPRQSFNKTYQANGYVDIIKTEYVIKNNKLHGDSVIAFITPRVIEVDMMDDFDYLEYQMARNPGITKKLFGRKRSEL